jgi:hypothetical protein
VSQHLNEAEDDDSPLHYRIADLDPRLNISKQKMIEISQEPLLFGNKVENAILFMIPKQHLL